VGAKLREIDDMRTRLETASSMTDTLAQAWDAFDLIRQTARQYEHQAGEWFAAYAMAAASAVHGRNLLTTMPPIPLTRATPATSDPEQPGDAETAADALADLAFLLSSRLKAAARHASHASGREICERAAAQADAIASLLVLDDGGDSHLR
jgi:cell division septum initiation protein DivIVA